MSQPNRLSLRFSLSSPTQDPGEGPAVDRAYAIFASDWTNPGSGIATIAPINDGLPLPEDIHFYSESGGAYQALIVARDSVLAIEENVGLIATPSNLDNFTSF